MNTLNKNQTNLVNKTNNASQMNSLDSIKFGPINEANFFEKLKKALRTRQVYENFLKCLALFNQEIISKSELINIVEPFLGKFANLYRWFKDYVENTSFQNVPNDTNLQNASNDSQAQANVDSNLNNNSLQVHSSNIQVNGANSNKYSNANKGNLINGKDRIALPPGSQNIHLEIDYLSCKQYGASYRDISSYPQPLSSGQTDLCKQVILKPSHTHTHSYTIR